MKLRILDNSLRLRLAQAEVSQLANEGTVTARTRFADGNAFSYRVESSPARVRPVATLDAGGITVSLPEDSVRTWANSDAVSIDGEQLLEDGAKLRLLVEKDFQCLAPREGEDESDLYPHPQGD